MSLRVLISVTHLLGVGHLARAAAIARGLAQAGHEVTLISGGNPASLVAMDGVRLIQLPPVHIAGTAFSTLLGADGSPVSEAVLHERQRMMVETVAECQPNVVITELFPFGRRVLADEFIAFIAAARCLDPRPAILCSIRDVLVAPAKMQRVDETHTRLRALYDGVLVHGDEDVLPLERSWPIAADLKPMLHYTGYVDEGAANKPPVNVVRNDEIIISGGGSASSLPLYKAAIAAAAIITNYKWRVLVGRGVAEDAFNALVEAAPTHVVVERVRTDFPTLLAQAALSVSQAGYNTVVDLLRARVRSVVVPFEAGNETEQRLRAEGLAQAGIWPFTVVPEATLTAQTLADAIINTFKCEVPSKAAIRRDGVATSIAFIERFGLRAQYPALSCALDEVAAAGRKVRLWWRDDDAIAPTPALEQLLMLSQKHAVPLAIAAVPASASEALAARLAHAPLASVLVHGLSHTNHASITDKKAEFGAHRALSALMADAAEGLRLARARFGEVLLPVFVPPWNRISSDLAKQLGTLGYCGLSTAGKTRTLADITVINTHLDPIAWHEGGGLLPPSLIDSRAAEQVLLQCNSSAPIALGLLTHHLVQDEATWAYIDNLLAWITCHPAVEVVDARDIFCCS
ncbi:glycosyltransferase [Pseudochelatococcus sp. G4_1912]|uniref:glycosyltransferase n=1 Tax=Pseudochelatococcus sp. G4_1912 TaxID=3114288 RepID=UPI0039C63757